LFRSVDEKSDGVEYRRNLLRDIIYTHLIHMEHHEVDLSVEILSIFGRVGVCSFSDGKRGADRWISNRTKVFYEVLYDFLYHRLLF
jgi:hypothetical protein